MIRRAFSVALLATVSAALAGPGAAQFTDLRSNPRVSSTAPARHASAAVTTNVVINFNQAMNPATINAGTLHVFGRQSGAAAGALTFSNGNRRATFNPSQDFFAGETITVSLSKTVRSAQGVALKPAGYTYQFGTRVSPSALQLTQLDVMSNNMGEQTRIYGANAVDLNGDRFPDLATINEVSSDVRVFLNSADGSGLYGNYLSPTPIGIEASPNDAADFNGDGFADLCVSASSSHDIWILLGAGDGSFSSVASVATGLQPHGIVALDVDMDGDVDIVNATGVGNKLARFLNNGSGSFSSATFFEGGVNGEYGLASGDMNNDGILDLVVSGNNSEELAVHLGQGDGTFVQAGPAQDSGGSTWVVVLGDVNNDGRLDASTANSFSGNGAILLGNGNGTFGAPQLTSIGAHTVSTDLGDLDGDGNLDWVISSFGGGFWRVYRGNGTGGFTFVEQIDAPSNPSCAVLLDTDKDGDLDVALTDEIADVVILMENQ